MNTEKIHTLEQILDAMDIVENARGILGLSTEDRFELERASVKLRNLERSVIRMKTNELLASLVADAEALDALSCQMRQSAEKLAGVAIAIEKAAQVVAGFVEVVAAVAASGLLKGEQQP
ncbi:MAG TPA: hypothetical protein VL947_11585 [Cytophagales bacterium]|nr:hypothetical protein [Cytophagales bacterium]